MLKNNLIKFVILNLSSIVNIFSIFLLQYFLSIHLNIYEFGLYSTLISTVFIFLPLLNFGISPQLIKNHFNINKSSVLGFEKLFKQLILLCLINFIVIYVFLYFFLKINNNVIVFAFAFHLITSVFFEILYSKYQHNFHYNKILFLNILFNFFKLIALIIIIYQKNNINIITVAYIYLFSSIPIFILFYINFFSYFKNFFQNSIFNIEFIKKNESLAFGINGIAFYLFYFADVIIIKVICGNIIAGYYSLALSIIFFTFYIPHLTIDKFIQNYFYIYFFNNKISKLKKIFQYTYLGFFICGTLLTLIIYFLSEYIIKYVYIDKFDNSILFINIMCFSIVFRFLTSVNSGLIFVTEKIFNVSIFWLVLSVLKILVNLYLLIFLDPIFIAYSFVIFELLLLIIFIFYKNKYLKM